MTVDQLIKHFGSQAKVAEALGCSQPCVSNWRSRKKVPPLQQLKAERLTKGKLKADTKILKVSRA